MHLVQTVETEYFDGLLSCGCAKHEARMIANLLGKNGDTVESLRELIAVPPQAEVLLRAFAREHPKSEHGIEERLAYGRRVGQEFERLVRQNADDGESKPAIEAEGPSQRG